MWSAIVPIADELIAIDPLNQNTALIVARALREAGENDRALATLERIEALPVFVESMQLQPAGERTTLRGQVIGNSAAAGTPIQLRFTFYNDSAQAGTETVTVNAPAAEQTRDFQVQIQSAANGYRYELVN
jgi:DNA-binding SARP family transcriptional activator